jgi:hypothetical protein
VVGFDDIPVAAYVTPPLTTARQPFDAAAEQGLTLLVHAIERPHDDPPPVSEPPVEMVVRASTAPPAIRTAPGRGRRAIPRSRRGPHGPPSSNGGSTIQTEQV